MMVKMLKGKTGKRGKQSKAQPEQSQTAQRLFVSQRDQRVDFRRTPRRNVARKEGR